MSSNLSVFLPAMALGKGVNSTDGDIKGDAVVRTAAEPDIGHPTQQITFSMDQLDTQDKIESVLGVSVEAEGRYGLISGSARFNFAKECSLNQFGLFLYVRCMVVNGFEQLRDVSLKPTALDRLHAGGNEFFDAYGDTFVAGTQNGGEFVCTMSISTSNEQERSQISASLELSGGTPLTGGSLTADFTSKLNKVHEQHTVTVRTYVEGGDPSRTLPTTVDEIVGYATAFPQMVASHGSPVRVLLQSYRETDNFPTQAELLAASSGQLEILTQIVARRREAMQLSNDIYYVLSHASQFPDLTAPDRQKLAEVSTELSAKINLMSRELRTCAARPQECTHSDYTPPQIQVPSRGVDPIEKKKMNLPGNINLGAANGMQKSQAGWTYQEYDQGAIFASPDRSRIYEVHGDIYAAYRQDSMHRGRMGFPCSDELPARENGRVSKFENGWILWSPPHQISFHLYQAFGGEDSVLGLVPPWIIY